MANGISLQFANARIKSLERYLLTADKLTRMIESRDLDEAVRVLAECNYGGGLVLDDPKKFDKLLAAEEAGLCEMVQTLCPDGYGMDCFLLRNDYHNAKVLYKARLMGSDESTALKPNGLLGDLLPTITAQTYGILPKPLAEAMQQLEDKAVNSEVSPGEIDITIDQAYFRDVFSRLSKCKKTVIQKYFIMLVDYTNLLTLARCRALGLTEKLFIQSFIPGGTLDLSKLKPLLELSAEGASEKMKFSDFAEGFRLLAQDTEPLVAFEAYMDSELIRLLKKDKNDMFSPAPVAGFYLGKLAELKVVRLVLVCINNNVDKAVIRRRLRETYA